MRYLLAFVSSVAVIGSVLFFSDRAGVFLVDDVEIQIQTPSLHESFYEEKRQRLRTQLDRFKGQKLWKVRITEISQTLGAHDWIADVQVFRHFPNHLRVNIAPKAVALVYQSTHGQILPVASDGSFLLPASSSQVPDVPIIRGKSFADSLDLRQKAVDLISHMPTSGKLTANAVSEISYRERDGFTLLLHNNFARVQIGNEDFKKKVSRISQVMSYLDTHAIEGRSFDASYSRKVLVRVKKQPNP